MVQQYLRGHHRHWIGKRQIYSLVWGRTTESTFYALIHLFGKYISSSCHIQNEHSGESRQRVSKTEVSTTTGFRLIITPSKPSVTSTILSLLSVWSWEPEVLNLPVHRRNDLLGHPGRRCWGAPCSHKRLTHGNLQKWHRAQELGMWGSKKSCLNF